MTHRKTLPDQERKATIQREPKIEKFTRIDNAALRNERLSWKARGILAYVLSLPDDWRLWLSELTNHATDGKHSTRSGVQELMDAGHISRVQERDEAGRITAWRYTVHEKPCEPLSENRKVDPLSENQDLDNQDLDNQTLLTTDVLTTDSTKKEVAGATPANFQGWLERLKDSKNRQADLVEMYIVLFPDHKPPAFSYMSRVAKRIGASRLAQLMWECSTRPPVGDVLAYIQGAEKNRKKRAGTGPDNGAERKEMTEAQKAAFTAARQQREENSG
jgi:hypothetical protein